MKLGDIYRTAYEAGIENDPPGAETARRGLEKAKAAYDKLDEDEKRFFDLDSLENPYADTRINHGDPDSEVRGLLAGIDMEVGEVLLADRLRERGEPIDLVFAHHPEGSGFARLDRVMPMQADMWHGHGVRIGAAEALIGPRGAEVRRRMMPLNHYRAIDAAALLGISFLSCHTPADNCVSRFLTCHIEEERPETLGELVKSLRAIPEYEDAARKGAGPTLLIGSAEARCGKTVVDVTGGTEGPIDALDRLSEAGVDTLVGMHYSEEHRKRAESLHLNVVVAGHIASDAIGMNLVLDKLEPRGVKVYAASGLLRVRRY